MRNVIMQPVMNGWTAKVGCQTLAFLSLQDMLDKLGAYMEAPDDGAALEKQWIVSAQNAKITLNDRMVDCMIVPDTSPCMRRMHMLLSDVQAIRRNSGAPVVGVAPMANGWVAVFDYDLYIFSSVEGVLDLVGKFMRDPDGAREDLRNNAKNKYLVAPVCGKNPGEAMPAMGVPLAAVQESP